jgi:hypothetical protein
VAIRRTNKELTSASIDTGRIAFPVPSAEFIQNAVYLLSFRFEKELGAETSVGATLNTNAKLRRKDSPKGKIEPQACKVKEIEIVMYRDFVDATPTVTVNQLLK